MEFEYPSFRMNLEFQGIVRDAYYFMISIEAADIEHVIPFQLGAPRGIPLREPPPSPAFYAAALYIVHDLRELLREGVQKSVDRHMRAERRASHLELQEKTEMTEHAMDVAKAIGEGELAKAEADLTRRLQAPQKRGRSRMSGLGESYKTAGARQLAEDGFTEIREIALTGKGPGLWYEATEPAFVLFPKGPHEWTPRRKPEAKRDTVLLLRQGRNIWHLFYAFEGTGSGASPKEALSGGLGDVLDLDKSIRRYCDLVLAAPERLVTTYAGLRAAQSQCEHELQNQDSDQE